MLYGWGRNPTHTLKYCGLEWKGKRRNGGQEKYVHVSDVRGQKGERVRGKCITKERRRLNLGSEAALGIL